MKKKIYCAKCGEAVNLQNDYCVRCGIKFKKFDFYEQYISKIGLLSSKQYEPVFIKKYGPFQKNVSLKLCLFGGWFGAHKFYEKNYFVALVYLLSLGVLMIGWLIDLTSILRMPKQYYTFKVIKLSKMSEM